MKNITGRLIRFPLGNVLYVGQTICEEIGDFTVTKINDTKAEAENSFSVAFISFDSEYECWYVTSICMKSAIESLQEFIK